MFIWPPTVCQYDWETWALRGPPQARQCPGGTVGLILTDASLSCWKTQLWPKMTESRFLQVIRLDVNIISIRHVAMAPEAAKQPHTTMLPPPCSPVGTVIFGLGCAQQFLSSLPELTFAFQMLFEFRASSDPEARTTVSWNINSQRVQISNNHIGRIPGCLTSFLPSKYFH